MVFFAYYPITASAHDLNQISAEMRDVLWQEIRTYLLSNPEIIEEMLATLQQREDAAKLESQQRALNTYADAIFNDPNSWEGGNPNGDITIVEFIDYKCGYCRKAHPEIHEILATDSEIRIIIKEYPILSEDSIYSARLAIASLRKGGREAYKKTHDFLMRHSGSIDAAIIKKIAQTAGIDEEILQSDALSQEVTNIIATNYELAEALSINGTPAFIIQNDLIGGYLPINEMRKIIHEQRQQN